MKFEYPVGGSEYQGRHTIKLVKKSGQAMIVDAFKILTEEDAAEYDADNMNEKIINICLLYTSRCV